MNGEAPSAGARPPGGGRQVPLGAACRARRSARCRLGPLLRLRRGGGGGGERAEQPGRARREPGRRRRWAPGAWLRLGRAAPHT